MNRRSFFGLLAAAPIAIAVGPVVASTVSLERVGLNGLPVSQCTWEDYEAAAKIGDTILVRKPTRFVVREVHDFTWHTDEFLEVTPATPQDLAAYRAANYVETRIRMESASYVPAAC